MYCFLQLKYLRCLDLVQAAQRLNMLMSWQGGMVVGQVKRRRRDGVGMVYGVVERQLCIHKCSINRLFLMFCIGKVKQQLCIYMKFQHVQIMSAYEINDRQITISNCLQQRKSCVITFTDVSNHQNSTLSGTIAKNKFRYSPVFYLATTQTSPP